MSTIKLTFATLHQLRILKAKRNAKTYDVLLREMIAEAKR